MAPANQKARSSTEVATKDIATQGDVILLVGTGDKTTKLRVFSQCLRAGSKVFAAMLGSNWSEGQGLSELSPKEVALPDDDATAMCYICQCLHFSDNRCHRKTPSQNEIVSLILHADKYDVILAVEPLVQHCLQKIKLSTTGDRIRLYAAACRLPSPQLEYPFIFDLVSEHIGSFFEFLADPVVGEMLHYEDCVKFEEVRMQLKLSLLSLLERETCGENCEESLPGVSPRDTWHDEAMGTAKLSDVIFALKICFEEDPNEHTLHPHRRGQKPRDESCGCAHILYTRLDRLYDEVMKRLVDSTHPFDGI